MQIAEKVNTKQHHEANLLGLQCDFDSDMKEDNLLKTFEYEVSSVKNLKMLAARQNNQKSYDCEHFLHAVLN